MIQVVPLKLNYEVGTKLMKKSTFGKNYHLSFIILYL